MQTYPKQILSLQQQLQTYINAGMTVSSNSEALEALRNIGYYRLRGYCFQFYDNSTKHYAPGTSFSQILSIYSFDTELSHLIFKMISAIEVTLRARMTQALLTHNDALIMNDPSIFEDKKLYWQNKSAIASEVARSTDVFIKHNFDNHDGMIPIWAIVEVLSFGTLSKCIKNLKAAAGYSFGLLTDQYKFTSPNGNSVKPSKKMFTSWIQSVSVLRNMCAHNSRIYNRTINAAPELIAIDKINPQPQYNGLYQILLAMKYLRPSDDIWNEFNSDLQDLINKYSKYIDLNRLNFPADWKNHFIV